MATTKATTLAHTLGGIAGSIETAEINRLDGVNADIQTQLDDLDTAKAPKASPTFTGDSVFDTDTLKVDATNNRVGIGTANPEANSSLHVVSSGYHPLIVNTTSAGGGGLTVRHSDTQKMYVGTGGSTHLSNSSTNDGIIRATGDFRIATGGNNERITITSSGSTLIGKTSSDANTVGFETSSGTTIITANDAKPIIANRKTSDGEIVEFRKDNTIVGSIKSRSGVIGLEIHSPSNGKLVRDGTESAQWHGSYFAPGGDNAQTLGISGNRWSVIHAASSSIQTSDINEKQDIEEISETEKRVAVACKSLMRKFRFKDAVEKKGDEARIHFGIIAQDLKSAFEAEGLVAERYAMFCKDVWYEHEGETYTTQEEAPEGATKKELLGVRYSELFAFIISAI
tara:strand:- start:1 stop:1194 length:1194 start_codon:yes stop_codon:yes gene_type:complete